MDKNWHGAIKTQDNIEKGLYDKDYRADIGISAGLYGFIRAKRCRGKSAIREEKEKQHQRDYGTTSNSRGSPYLWTQSYSW